MHRDIENNSTRNEKNNFIQDFIKLIKQKIENEVQQEKTLVIDRFESQFAVCENRLTLEMENIEISKLPQNIKVGDVIKYKNNQYEIDEQERAEIEERIKEKMKNLFEN